MRKPLSLRRLRHPRNAPPQNGTPLPRPHPAHTAGGRSISGLWEWFERIVLMATLISIGLGTWAFLIDYEDRKQARMVNAATLEEIKASQIARELERKVNEATLTEIEDSRETRREEAIARAWSLLTTPATGNSGKREALEYLAGQGVSLRGIDLSCAKMGGGWDAEKKKCDNPIDLRQLNLEITGPTAPHLHRMNLEGADLTSARFRGVSIFHTTLSGSQLKAADLSASKLFRSELSGADCSGIDLEGATVSNVEAVMTEFSFANLSNTQFYRSNLTGADFGSAILSGSQFAGAQLTASYFLTAALDDSVDFTDSWAWADEPPIGLPATIPVTLCKYQDGMDRFTRPEPCLPPG